MQRNLSHKRKPFALNVAREMRERETLRSGARIKEYVSCEIHVTAPWTRRTGETCMREREREEGGGGWRTLRGGGKGFWIWIWEGELTRVSWLKPQTAPWRHRHACQQNTAPNTLSLALTRMIHSSLPHSHACSCHLCCFLFWCWIFILILSSDLCASYLLHWV